MEEKEFWQMAYLIALHKTGYNHEAKKSADKALEDYKEFKSGGS